MSAPSDDQVELPTPTNHDSPWSRDSLHTFQQLKRPSFIHNSSLVAITGPSAKALTDVAITGPNAKALTDVGHEVLLSQKFIISQTDVTGIVQSTHGSVINLNESDAGADDERPSPTSSFTDEFSEYDSNDLEHGSTDCPSALRGSQTTETMKPDEYSVPPSLTRPTRIRFRSRVRITSGLNRHRRSTTDAGTRNGTVQSSGGEGNYFCFTPSSSVSASPSSSISAPLHSRMDDEADRPGWGPLGQRVSRFAKKNRVRHIGSSDDPQLWGKFARVEGLSGPSGRIGVTETSPLMPPSRAVKTHTHRERRRECYCPDCAFSLSRQLSPEEVDEIFGKWPNRMLNYQWWWWQAEAVLCCRCLDETDDEFH